MHESKIHDSPIRSRVITIFMLFIVVALGCPTARADPAKNVRDLMAPDDFSASGLEKLSDEELNHLSEWVERYRAGAVSGPPPPVRPSQMTVAERAEYQEQQEQKKDFELVAKVLPAFRGWSGKTVFKLDNGQVWQQRQVGKMAYSGSDATVVITRNIFGRYVLTHQESGRAVGVRRVR